MGREISGGRKTAYYLGAGLQVVGVLTFLSVFFTFATNFGSFNNFEGNAKSMMFRAFGGMLIMVIGKVVSGIGARGMAGSGILLDPERARQDLEPYSRMTGGFVKDVLEEADLNIGSKPVQVVMVRCPSCKSLNQEAANFCQECGTKF